MSDQLLEIQALSLEILEMERRRRDSSPAGLRILELMRHRREAERQLQRSLDGFRRALHPSSRRKQGRSR